MATIQSPPEFSPAKFTISEARRVQISEATLENYKDWGIPIPYPVFLSPSYELDPRSFETELFDGVADKDSSQHEDIRAIGEEDGRDIYAEIAPVLEESFRELESFGVISRDGEVLKSEPPHVLVHPFKLALYLSIYAEEMAENLELRDQVAEILDKLFLLGVLPYVFENLASLLALNNEGKSQHQTARAFLNAIRDTLRNQTERLFRRAEYFRQESYLSIPTEEFQKVLGHGRGYGGVDQVIVPIDTLEELVSDALKRSYSYQRKRDEADNNYLEIASTWQEEKVIRRTHSRVLAGFLGWSLRRRRFTEAETRIEVVPINVATHHWLYECIRTISGDFVSGLSLNTIEFEYDGALPVPTVTDEIDLRPVSWAERAFSLAGELAVFKRRTSLGKKLLDEADNLRDLYAFDEDFRNDWNRYGEILRDVDAIKAEVKEYDYELDFNSVTDSTKTTLGLFKRRRFQYLQSVTKYRTVTRRHKKTKGWGPFKRTKRWTTTRRVPYTASVLKTGVQEVPVGVDWDPVATYLDEDVSKSTYMVLNSDGSENQEFTKQNLQELREAILAAKGVTIAAEASPKNSDKDYRLFAIADNELRDQYGTPLSEVMREADTKNGRQLLLLLLPVIERDENGESITVAYKAIHNPVGLRNLYSRPAFTLIEEHAIEFGEDCNYYVGPLTHTETLLPGEKRFVTLKHDFRRVSETTFSNKSTSQQSNRNTSEIQDQVRVEIRKLNRQSQKNSWSVSASGSGNWGFAKAGGSASASGERTKSSERSRSRLTDQLSKVMSEASSQNEVVISTSSSETTEESTARETRVEIENFNTGRSLTHRFHQLMRHYRSLTKITSVKVLVSYEEEFVSGYGYRRGELLELDELDRIVPQFAESDRSRFIVALKKEIRELYGDDIIEADGVLAYKTDGQSSTSSSWYVNSGAYVIHSDIGSDEILEAYVSDARAAEIASIHGDSAWKNAAAEAIGRGEVVYPSAVTEFKIVKAERENAEE